MSLRIVSKERAAAEAALSAVAKRIGSLDLSRLEFLADSAFADRVGRIQSIVNQLDEFSEGTFYDAKDSLVTSMEQDIQITEERLEHDVAQIPRDAIADWVDPMYQILAVVKGRAANKETLKAAASAAAAWRRAILEYEELLDHVRRSEWDQESKA